MSDLAELLKEHYDNHPAMEVRDAIKFIYQSHMGPGHLISDERAALDRLAEEWDRLPADPSSPLSEPLGNGLCRLSLSTCKGIKLSIKTLNRLFVLTAQKTVLDRAGLEQDLELLQALPFSQESSKRYLAQYRAQGCPALSHSKTYRDTYSPAYRVVFQYYVNQIPLLAAVDQLLTQGQPVLVAIDGPCASGKSTLGAALAELYCCPLLHMDDFFLLPQDRTPERLAKPGENVDHERFDREVLCGIPALAVPVRLLWPGCPCGARPPHCGRGKLLSAPQPTGPLPASGVGRGPLGGPPDPSGSAGPRLRRSFFEPLDPSGGPLFPGLSCERLLPDPLFRAIKSCRSFQKKDRQLFTFR